MHFEDIAEFAGAKSRYGFEILRINFGFFSPGLLMVCKYRMIKGFMYRLYINVMNLEQHRLSSLARHTIKVKFSYLSDSVLKSYLLKIQLILL